MAYQTIYEYSGTLYGRTIDVEIQKDSSSTLTEDTIDIIELKRRAGGESNDIATPIIGQIFSAKVIDKNYTNNGFIYDEIQATSDLRVKITIDTVVWNGYAALTSFRRELEPEYSIYEIGLQFVDGLFRLKSEPADSTETYFYEQIQEYLDRIGFGYDTYWVTNIEELISGNVTDIQTFMLRRTGNAFDMIKAVMQLLNCQLFQQDDQWVVLQRDIDLSSVSSHPKVTSGTYSFGNISTSTYVSQLTISNSDFREGAELDLIPSISDVQVNMQYVTRNINILEEFGISDQLKNQGTLLYPYQMVLNITGSITIYNFPTWQTTGSPFRSSGVGDFDNEWVVLQDGTPSDAVSSEWFGVINIEEYGKDGLDINIDAKVLIPDFEPSNASLDFAEIKLIIEDGNTYWLEEDGTWSATQVKWNFEYPLSSLVSAKFKSLNKRIEFPETKGNARITVDLFREVNSSDFGDLGISPITIAPASADFTNNVKAQTLNTKGDISFNINVDNIENYTISPSGLNADIPTDLGIEYKTDYYKIVDVCALKKAAQQSKPLQKLKIKMDSYDIKFLEIFTYDSKKYRLQAVNENVFEQTAEMVFVEYAYDETPVTLRRGIYS